MANTIQIKRGLEANRSSVTPAVGELLYTTDDKKVYVGDGTTAGGNPVAAGGAAITATASGALANGDLVVVNSDGTVSVVAGVSQAVGTAVVFEAASISHVKAVYDSSAQKVVIAYQDGIDGTAVVGTVSGTSISFGTPVVFGGNGWNTCTYDSTNNKVVVAYQDRPTLYGTAIVGTVSGTSISFGTAVVFNSTWTKPWASVYDSGSGKVVIGFEDDQNADIGRAVVGTVSGTSISFGSVVTFENADTTNMSMAYDANAGKVVIAYRDGGNSNYGTSVVGTVSGTSISFGTPVVFESAATADTATVYEPTAQKVVIAYSDAGNSFSGTAIVGTVSGTSISFGTPVVFLQDYADQISAEYDPTAQKICIFYRDFNNGQYGNIINCAVSGTSATFGTPVLLSQNVTVYTFTVYDTNAQKVVVGYSNGNNSYYGTSLVFQNASSNMTASNFIGISDGAYADTATATVQIVGAVDDAQTGLTAGQAYYVQNDGTLSTTAGDPSVFAGTAISSTQLIVKG